MKMKSLLVAGVAMAGLIAGSAFADVYMKGEDVAKLIVGKTIEGQYLACGVGRNDFREYYDANGTIRGGERPCQQAGKWKHYAGKWDVKDGKFCVYLGSDRTSGCFDYQVDEKGTLRRFDAKGGDVNFKMFDGNPDHL